MTLRRYLPLKASRGTQIPPKVRHFVQHRDRICVGRIVGMPGDCYGALELDHVRASGGIGLKSRSTADNLIAICSTHHRWKTEHGREARPLLLEYLLGVSV